MPEARYHPEAAAVDAPGRWHEGHASYPGRAAVLPAVLPLLRGIGMGHQKSAEAIVVGNTGRRRAEHETPDGRWAFEGDRRRRKTGLRCSVPALRVAAGSRESRIGCVKHHGRFAGIQTGGEEG